MNVESLTNYIVRVINITILKQLFCKNVFSVYHF